MAWIPSWVDRTVPPLRFSSETLTVTVESAKKVAAREWEPEDPQVHRIVYGLTVGSARDASGGTVYSSDAYFTVSGEGLDRTVVPIVESRVGYFHPVLVHVFKGRPLKFEFFNGYGSDLTFDVSVWFVEAKSREDYERVKSVVERLRV